MCGSNLRIPPSSRLSTFSATSSHLLTWKQQYPTSNWTEISEISLAVEEHVAACAHVALPLSAVHLAQLSKQFADTILDEGLSVAALQGTEYPVSFWMSTQDWNREVSLP